MFLKLLCISCFVVFGIVGSYKVDALECYHCNNISDPLTCNITAICSAQQVCFSQAFQRSDGIFYELGCREQQLCGGTDLTDDVGRSLREVTSVCHECCSADLCNTAACHIQKRSCHKCMGPPEMCETIHLPQPCDSIEQQYCINEVDNKDDARRTVIRRCGTLQECHDGWFMKYSSNDRCNNFEEQYIYTTAFYCEFCCSGDDCNNLINPPTKYHP